MKAAFDVLKTHSHNPLTKIRLKTPLMNERKYKNKLGGNIGILCEVPAPHGTLATALCCVYQSCSAISYKSGLNFPIVN